MARTGIELALLRNTQSESHCLLTTLLTGVLAGIAGVLLLPTISDLLGLARARRAPRRGTDATQSDDPPRLLFLVPAHNEELLIGSCLDSLFGLDYPLACRSVVVIADNCSDRTAEIARERGATVLERREPQHGGKPQALAWALNRLALEEIDGVTIIDADTVVDRGFARALSRAAPLRGRAVQGYNGVRNPTESALTQMAATLAIATYEFAYPHKRRAGLNVPLRGTGGCIGTDVLRRWGWTAFTIGEDAELYAQLTERGVVIDYAPHARLYAQEARSLRQSASQRRRWSGGKLTVLLRRWWSILRSRPIGFRQRLDLLAELSAPGPVVHLGWVVLACAAAMLLAAPRSLVLAALLGASLGRPAFYAIAALAVHPNRAAAVRAFVFLPAYAAWRLVTELKAWRTVGHKPWVRTDRHRHTGDVFHTG